MKDVTSEKAFEEWTQDEWFLILWSFMNDLPVKEWNEFVNELIYKNRFASSHKVVDVIKDYAKRCTATIKKGQVLYRARIYHQDPLREFVSDVYKNTKIKKQREQNETIDITNEYFNMLLANVWMAITKGNLWGKQVIEAYHKWQRKKFKGYNSSDSGAPPADSGSAGRINPERIRYLYLADDPQTAIYEVRPTIGQHVSVATFKTNEEIKIYDLASEIKHHEKEHEDNDFSLFYEIQQRFSEPNTGDAFRYLPTQYLGEMIKQMGFDGLRFNSSLKKGGVNVVLFDDKKCKAICSDLIRVDDIKLKLVNPDIYQFEECFNSDISNSQ